MKPEIFTTDEIKVDYNDIEYGYSNQTMVQLTSEDVEIIFGEVRLDEKGLPYKKLTSSMRLSHEHFEKFVANCNAQIINLKQLKEEYGK